MKSLISAASAAALLTVAASAAWAVPLTYGINRSIGAGSVIGSITTDGMFGQLSSANVTGWNLLLNDGTTSYPLMSGSSSVFITGADVSADSNHIYFNFSGSDSGVFLFQQSLFSGAHYYCDATVAAAFYCKPGESVVPTDVFSNPGFPNVARVGTIAIADAVIPSVPEPSTVALLTLGLALIGTRKARWSALVAPSAPVGR